MLRELSPAYLSSYSQSGDYDQRRCLHLAACEGSAHTIKELIKHGGAKHIGFLHDAYTRDAWFWEPIDSLRRISLTGLLVCFGRDESRVVAAVLLSFCWVLIYHHASPFARSDDRLIADIANFQITGGSVILSTTLLACYRDGLSLALPQIKQCRAICRTS